MCNDQSKYADDTSTGYTALSFKAPTNLSGYITGEGLDTGANAHVFLPTAASGGSDTTHFCDYAYTSTGWRVFRHGGRWSSGSGCGLFSAGLSDPSSGSASYIGSRLLYIPS